MKYRILGSMPFATKSLLFTAPSSPLNSSLCLSSGKGKEHVVYSSSITPTQSLLRNNNWDIFYCCDIMGFENRIMFDDQTAGMLITRE
jgi:hypothetical protein